MVDEIVRLTEYSHGAGCGCKLSPEVLTNILSHVRKQSSDPNLLVGYGARDDAAVYALDQDRVLISTTDFFTPIVDDPSDFGGIAAVNAISDIYAMGGTPLLAIAILGWPVNRLSAALAGQVLDGAAEACQRAGITLAGGHSIDTPEPIFGLAVTGVAPRGIVRTNSQAKPGCELFLTKPLGIGILTTAMKRGVLNENDFSQAREQMLRLNDIGPELARVSGVRSITDVTGFGLLGHLLEICEGSGVSAVIKFSAIPQLQRVDYYVGENCIPGGTTRNFSSYGHKVSRLTEHQISVLCDPQTSGGLLVAVDPSARDEFHSIARLRGLDLSSFGLLCPSSVNPIITVI
jgi:selenide, water dikinase